MSQSRTKLPLPRAEMAGGVRSPAQTALAGKDTGPVCTDSTGLWFSIRLWELHHPAVPAEEGQAHQRAWCSRSYFRAELVQHCASPDYLTPTGRDFRPQM